MTRDPAQAMPLLQALSGAVTVRAIYPPGHPRIADAIGRLMKTLRACLRDRDAEDITFLIIDRELLIDDRPTRAHKAHLGSLVRILSRLGVERLSLAEDLDVEECHRLVDGLAGSGELDSTAHAIIGRIQLVEDEEEEGEGLSGSDRPELSEKDVDRVEEAFLRFRSDSEGSIEDLDRLLWRFVEGMDRAGRSLLLLGTMKLSDQQLFIHSINVSLLALAQARGLGVEGQALHDIGLAALLHDIGKLSLPQALFEKRERYTDLEWRIVQRHPELGAAQLCGLVGAPPLTILVAYEHHLRWDGLPSYPSPATPRLPCLASQLTAIADTYDVMIAGQGLAGGAAGESALRVWRERSGTYLDPFLVGNFVMTLSDVQG